MKPTAKTLTLQGVAERTGIKRRKLYRMIADGSFPVEPIKNTDPRLWNSDAVDAWMKNK